MSDAYKEHSVIFLSPSCAECSAYGEERSWCNSPEDACEKCGAPWVAFDLRETPTAPERITPRETSGLTTE